MRMGVELQLTAIRFGGTFFARTRAFKPGEYVVRARRLAASTPQRHLQSGIARRDANRPSDQGLLNSSLS